MARAKKKSASELAAKMMGAPKKAPVTTPAPKVVSADATANAPTAKAATATAKAPTAKVATATANAPTAKAATATAKAATAKAATAKAPASTGKAASSPGAKATGKASPHQLALEVALGEGDGRAALGAALDWWRAERAPALADLVDAISARVSGEAVTTDAAWNKLAVARDPVALGALLAGVTQLPVSFLPTAAELLAAFPDDPRIAKAVSIWAIDPPTTSSSTYPFWVKMLAAVAAIRDARAIAGFRERLALPMEASKQFPRDKNKKPSQFWPKFYKALEKAIATLEALPAVPVDAKTIARLAKQAADLAPAAIQATGPAKKAPAVDGPPLAQALAHVKAGDVQAAIDALLVAWRADRIPAIADAIDRATVLLPAYDIAFATTKKDSYEPWSAAYAADPMAAMPQLLQYINAGTAKLAELRLAALANLPDDPRIGMRLAELAGFRQISPERTQYWKTLLELIARTKDVRTCAALCVYFDNFTGRYFNHHGQARKYIADFAQRPEGSFRRWPLEPSPDDAKQLAKIHAALAALEGKDQRRALLDAIVESPGDDEPILVYADFLQGRGDPRGELLALDHKLKKQGTLTAAEEKHRGMLRETPYLRGPFDDVEDVFSAKHTAPYEHALARVIHLGAWVGTLTWRRLAQHPPTMLVETLHFREHLLVRKPTADDFTAFLAAASTLTAIRDVPPRLADELQPAWQKRFRHDGDAIVRVR